MSLFPRLAVAAALTIALTACGSGFDSGLPKKKQLDELTNAESKAFCEAQADYMVQNIDINATHRMSCYITGVGAGTVADLTGGDGKAACEAARDNCLDSEPTQLDSDCSDVETSECTATVGDAETCVEDMLKAFNSYYAEVNSRMSQSCDPEHYEADLAVLEEVDVEEPESCKAVEATCPDDEN